MDNMEKNNTLHTDLLIKKINGQLTIEEQAVLDIWLQQSEQNRQTATEFQRIWSHLAPVEPLDLALDIEGDFKLVMEKAKSLDKKPNPVIAPLSFWQRPIGRVAAAISFILLATGVLYMYNQSNVQTYIVTANQDRHEVVLSDGSKVWLRKGATLSYTDDFNKRNRFVKLDGEAFFDVKHDNVNQFCVKTNQEEVIEVLGTTFNVLESDKATIVTVKEGKVRFSLTKADQEIILTSGQQGEHNKLKSKLTLKEKVSQNEFAWFNKGLVFDRTPLNQAIADLEKYYNVKINLDNNLVNQCPYTARLNGQTIQQVLESFKSIFHVTAVEQISEHEFKVKGGYCNE
jgi:transmembrane sensor